MIILLISALSGAIGIVLSKIILTRRHMSVHVFAPLLFLFLFLVTAVIVPWIGKFHIAAALKPGPLVLFLAMVVIAGIWNVFYYRAIKNETLQEFELIILLVPLVTTLLSTIILPEERNVRVAVAAVVASLALLFSHLEKRHLAFGKFSEWLLVGVVLISIESILIKQLLTIWSPASLYMARTFYVFLFLAGLSQPSFEHLTPKSVGLTFITAVAGVVLMVTKFYGYLTVGIVYTTLVLILEPIFTLILDKLVLHEKFKPKFIMATALIVLAVIYGSLTR